MFNASLVWLTRLTSGFVIIDLLLVWRPVYHLNMVIAEADVNVFSCFQFCILHFQQVFMCLLLLIDLDIKHCLVKWLMASHTDLHTIFDLSKQSRLTHKKKKIIIYILWRNKIDYIHNCKAFISHIPRNSFSPKVNPMKRPVKEMYNRDLFIIVHLSDVTRWV